jgi:hypothetical protein
MYDSEEEFRYSMIVMLKATLLKQYARHVLHVNPSFVNSLY